MNGKRFIVVLTLLIALLTACMPGQPKGAPVVEPSPTPFQPEPTSTPLPATSTAPNTPTPPPTPRPTRTQFSTHTAVPPTEVMATKVVKAGDKLVPILLYHHVSSEISNSQYSIDPASFKEQMKWLKKHGYATITVSELARLIRNGGAMPKRPVIITFDDGYVDVYKNAFPVLRKLGFVATFYIIANTVDTPGNLSSEELKRLADAGWEIGSHSMTHSDLNQSYNLEYEIVESKQLLEFSLGFPITSFCYPYGLAAPSVINYTINAGYQAAVGLGSNFEHSLDTLYYLNRYEIQNWFGLDEFIKYLPWDDQ
ncbi:MAG TPA: polysaccharide deacetylase family protein [Anaerolineaceae bacterium]|nr:polysaccharide deacetylase family protein [Anaerolineaceae bacterium]